MTCAALADCHPNVLFARICDQRDALEHLEWRFRSRRIFWCGSTARYVQTHPVRRTRLCTALRSRYKRLQAWAAGIIPVSRLPHDHLPLSFTTSYTRQMTGLDPQRDTILSVACFVTDHLLVPLDQTGFEAIIHHDSLTLGNMNDWCINTHTASGLVDQCINSAVTAEDAASNLLAYIKSHVTNKGTALLAGNSVHADKMFLMQLPWNQVLHWLHYRILDVSAIKEGVRRWCEDEVLQGVPRKALKHTAREDILESIEEARYYQRLFGQMRIPSTLGSDSSQDSAQPSTTGVDGYGNSLPVGAKRQNSGTKRSATEAGLHSPVNSNGSITSMIPNPNLGSNGDQSGSPKPFQSDDEGFRTDVP